MTHPPFNREDAAIFRRYALHHVGAPMVEAEPSDDMSQDMLDLSLASFKDLINDAFDTARDDGTPFRVYPAYIDTTAPEAFATDVNGLYLIGMHVGLAATCFELACFCMAQANIFPHMGDASAETSPPPINGYPPGFWSRMGGAEVDQSTFLQNMQPIMPKGANRYELAVMLAILMMRFIWLHELYHCINGHLDKIKVINGLSRMQEIAAMPPHTANHRTLSQAEMHELEFDADRTATYILCKFQYANRENIEAIRQLPLAHSLQLNIFAIYAVNWTIAELARLNGTASPESHPDPKQRLTNITTTLANHTLPECSGIKLAHDVALRQWAALRKIMTIF